MTESIMSRNFVHHGNGGSEYTDAMLAVQRARSNMATRQMSILATGRAMVDMADTYAEKAMAARKAARLMEEEKDTATYEVSKRNLDEQKEEIEERAEEAMNGEEKQDALSTDAAAESDAAEATNAEEGQTASAADKKDDDTKADEADVKTAEELMAEQQAAAEAQEKAAGKTEAADEQGKVSGTAEAATPQVQTPLHIVV